jgi:ferredoxin
MAIPIDNSTTFEVTLRAGDDREVRFAAAAGRSIVKSAALAGYILTTGCLQGRCAICRSRLISGQVGAARRRSKHAVSDPANRPDGCVLLCSVSPLSDVIVEPLSPWRTAAERVDRGA